MNKYGTDVFKGAASYYSRYRPMYPSSLIRFLVEEFALNGEQNLLDLGCGTGQLTIRFSDWTNKIVGIDTEPEMINEARRLHQQVRIGQIKWFNGTLEHYKESHNDQFSLVTIAKAFHWMDRARVLEELYDLIDEGGGVAIIDNYDPNKSLKPWQKNLSELIEKWYGKERRAGKSTYNHPVISHEEVLSNSKFEVEIHTLPTYEINWTIESILGNLYSTSYGARRFLGNKVEEFEKEVKQSLLEFSSSGEFRETVNVSVKLGRK
ncbi:SAM-dependent methyltransferase [Salimicrobium jeotgali]|uniref:Putative methyltransferase n=1 Tax=Salimicrobium jeotgali TaxID=1230341 RepID=K2G6Q5_9BACI|nr:class I SAM-dependent methyltransferase [Salimicrobium jeotgali]AKG03411.1 SAM-dependent methyltransferase [Salimicrobium jeotgali]EKE30873.1 putative methyltransferase [Salimicrobium jeotgali]MBM7697663.1 ubiquinone/menaquinone biosynthesis C-methylase UbiE [Salimicrobium jeotgali]